MSKKLSIEELKERTKTVTEIACGRWLDILSGLSPDLAPAVKANGKHVDCPFHGGKKDFRIARSSSRDSAAEAGYTICTCGSRSGYSNLMDANGWTFPEAVAAVGNFLGLDFDSEIFTDEKFLEAARVKRLERQKIAEKKAKQKDAWIKKELNAIGDKSISIHDPDASVGRMYFEEHRGLDASLLDGKYIRYCPSLDIYQNKEIVDTTPAIVSTIFACDGTPLTLHIIRLTPGGRLHPRWGRWIFPMGSSLSSKKGRVIPSCAPKSGILGISEGIETGLACAEGFKIPVWSLIAERNVRSFIPPDWCTVLIGCGDKDRSRTGEISMNALVERLRAEGWNGVFIPYFPDMEIPSSAKGVDWNDVINTLGQSGFPLIDLSLDALKPESEAT